MMDLQTIRALASKRAHVAAQQGLEPYVPYDANEVRNYGTSGHGIPFPNIGAYRPKGWHLVEELFVDATGLGLESEPAMTVSALKKRIEADINGGHAYGYAITEEGQFQVYIGVFTKVTGKTAKKRRR